MESHDKVTNALETTKPDDTYSVCDLGIGFITNSKSCNCLRGIFVTNSVQH